MTYLEITRGDDESIDVAVTDPDNDDAPVDLTDQELTFMVKEHPDDDDDDALIEKTTGAGITVADPETGVAVISIASEDTADISGTKYWELQVSGGSTQTLAGGRITIVPDLVRA
jgi:hypothetical protein